jgi:hypothetical protein
MPGSTDSLDVVAMIPRLIAARQQDANAVVQGAIEGGAD